MPLGLIISLSVTLILLVLSFLFKVAGKLRLTLPLIYFLLVSSILNKWAASHETLAFAILYILIAFSIISWLFALKNRWQERRYGMADKTCQRTWHSFRLCPLRF